MSAIVAADNGDGIPFNQIVERFKRLGDSWKRSSRLSKKHGRFLHGKDDQGRFKALSLGRVVWWSIIYAEGDQHFSYTAQLIADDPTDLIMRRSQAAPRAGRSRRRAPGCPSFRATRRTSTYSRTPSPNQRRS